MKFRLVEQLYNESDYNFNEDISMMTEVFDLSRDELFKAAEIDNIDSKENLDKLYDYCYSNGLYVNEVKWLEYKDLFDSNSRKLLCHGSRNGIIGNIRLDASGDSNDFGNGFYLGETLKQAGMFVSEDENSSIYLMSFNTQNLKAIRFSVSDNWMLAVAAFRDTLGEYINEPRVQKILDRINKADYIIAPIADNRMFELIDAFVNRQLTDKQTLYALSATHLGMQYVLKTEKTLNNLVNLDRCYVCPIERASFNKAGEVESNTSLNKAMLAKRRYKDQGNYIDELFR